MVWKNYVFVKNFQKAEVKTKNYNLLFWKLCPSPCPNWDGMHKQRPSRGQAWPWVRSLPWIRRFQLNLFGNLSVFIHLVHLLVIWQCPSGTAFGDNIVQFNFFFSSFGFPEDFRTEAKEVYRISVHQCEHFVGTSPTKFAPNFFLIFGKNSKSKKIEKFFFDFGSKNYADRCNLVSGVQQNSFFVQN